MQRIDFTVNLKKNTATFFIIEEAKKKQRFSKGTIKVLWFYFVLI